jgi:hypothetical protein
MAPKLHMETLHAEGGQSPFVARDESGHSDTVNHHDDLQYTDCPIRDCGEMVLASELDSHIEMHGEEDGENDVETAAIHGSSENARGDTSREVRSSLNESASQVSAKAAWKAILKMPDISSKSHSKPPPQLPQQLGVGPFLHVTLVVT